MTTSDILSAALDQGLTRGDVAIIPDACAANVYLSGERATLERARAIKAALLRATAADSVRVMVIV